MVKIFDAYAVLCWMQEEPGSSYIEHLLEQAEKEVIKIQISAINIGEIFYRLVKSGHSKEAASFLMDVKKKIFPWRVIPASNTRIWEAAKLKGEYRISYADAFALALARETGGAIVTRDPEIIEVCNSGRFLLDQIPSEWPLQAKK
ncbi:type II toxin-antitoxin system VapC family toxin [Moorella sp. ACPs]|uniref:type II toxin-antitoxin system VapC family toxin n=1 Tax=Neomoorella carbonis TaxID=3062783 RepID=UPI0032500015